MGPSFATVLWIVIISLDVALAIARPFLHHGPTKLSMALAIPALIILGAVVNALYNWLTSGHPLEAPRRQRVGRR